MPVTSQSHYDIPKTQKAIVFKENKGPITVEKEWPVTQPEDLAPGEVLVRLAYTGVCHTDLHAWYGDWPLDNKLPLVGGHEGAGYICAIGKNTNTKSKIGDAVGIKWLADSCLHCEECRKGYESVCPEVKNSGFGVDGSFQQYAVSYAAHVTPIPDGLPLDAAAPLLCAGVTVYKAIREFGGNPGETIVIPGAGGGLGHLACQYAVALGYRVIAVDSGEEKRKLIHSYGIDDFIDFKEVSDVPKKVKDSTGGRGAHGVIVVAASSKGYEDSIKYLRPHGKLVAVGMPPDTFIKAEVFWTIVNSSTYSGSYVGNRQDAIEALELAARGKVKTSFRVEKLDALPNVYEEMRASTLVGRVVSDCE